MKKQRCCAQSQPQRKPSLAMVGAPALPRFLFPTEVNVAGRDATESPLLFAIQSTHFEFQSSVASARDSLQSHQLVRSLIRFEAGFQETPNAESFSPTVEG